VFGCGNLKNDFSNGIAIYDKDLKIVSNFESNDIVFCMISIDD
jgi:hypothetical protein